MAKPKKITPAERPDPAELLAQMERPGVNWKILAQVVAGLGILWLVGFMVQPYVGYWGLVVVGVLTLAAIGFGIYVLRLTRKSAAIYEIMQGATDAEGRKEALRRLQSQKGNDAMSALAQAQLLAQDDPKAAMDLLETVDVEKAPAVVQDEVRANLGLFYLMHGKVKEARELADVIRLDRQPNARSKALYAAVVAEAFARTGNADEAKKLLETFDPDDSEFREVRPLLLRAQVFTYIAVKKRGLAQKAMERLAVADPNMLQPFLVKGAHPELAKMARDLLARTGLAPKQKMRVSRR